MLTDLFAAIALMLVLEGISPFLSPARFREALQSAARLDDRVLRLLGLASMVAGVAILYMVR
ncbi:MAG: DUF2065 domain-containing protein [Gammaproteobacteria bacterium]